MTNDFQLSEYALSDLLLEKCRNSLLAFTRFTMPEYEVNWHHKELCRVLNKLVSGEITRLIVQQPPRTGKSELVSRRLPAYWLGNNPDSQIIACSYSSGLSSRMNRDVQRVIDSPNYSLIFPDTKLYGENARTLVKGSYLRNSDIFEIVGHKGSYKSAGVGGGITGMGANIAIIDDYCKDQKEADSPVYRQSVWDWYTSTLLTRLEKDHCILITATRWHEDDLIGRILEQPNHGFEVISFPMINDETGDPLWENKFNKERCDEIKRNVGSRVWNSLYQQRPTALAGGIFQRSWFQYYRQLPDSFDEVIDSWDLSFKDNSTSDYVVGQKWARKGGKFYLLDMVRDRMDFPTTRQAIINLKNKDKRTNYALVEDKANGPAVISSLKAEVAGIVPFTPQGSKESRAHSVSALFEAGNVYIPFSANWLGDYIEELVNFPRYKNDDQVDSTTQALIRLGVNRAGDFTKLSKDNTIGSIVNLGRRESEW